MATADERHEDDDDPVRMTPSERAVWASLVAVTVSSGAYLALMVPTVLSRPVAEISWVRPMVWTMGLAVAGTVLLTVVFTVVAEARRRDGCPPAGRREVTSDIRDQEIGRFGSRAATVVLSAGAGGALVLAMLDADTLWIGNLLFLSGTATAVVETALKIRLYRRGLS